MEDFSAESPENYEQKCCVAFVLDVSSSMNGQPIDELNRGLQEFHTQISKDSTATNRLEVCVIEFSSSVTTLVLPSLAKNFVMPVLFTKGSTKLAHGIQEGIRVVKDQKQWYRNTGQDYYRPWIILITDGEPDSDQDLDILRNDIINGMAARDFHFFAIGVEGANMKKLTYISSPDFPPAPLKGLEFSAFFKWLSQSLGSGGITGSKGGTDDTVTFPDPSDWLKVPFQVK